MHHLAKEGLLEGQLTACLRVLLSFFKDHILCVCLQNFTGDVCPSVKYCSSLSRAWHCTILWAAFHLKSSFKLTISTHQSPWSYYHAIQMVFAYCSLTYIPFSHSFTCVNITSLCPLSFYFWITPFHLYLSYTIYSSVKQWFQLLGSIKQASLSTGL